MDSDLLPLLSPGVEVFVMLSPAHARVGSESCQQGQEPAPLPQHSYPTPQKKKKNKTNWQLAEKLFLPHHSKAGNIQCSTRLDYAVPGTKVHSPPTKCRINLDFSWV